MGRVRPRPRRDDPEGDAETQRAYAALSVTQASQLITAAVAILAVAGAFATFALDKMSPSDTAKVLWWVGVITIIFSVLAGTMFISKTKHGLWYETLKPNDTRAVYWAQWTLVAIALLMFMAAGLNAGGSRDDPQKRIADTLEQAKPVLDEINDTLKQAAAQLAPATAVPTDTPEEPAVEEPDAGSTDVAGTP